MTASGSVGPRQGDDGSHIAGKLRRRDFRFFWAGQTVSELGSQVSQLAVPLIAIRALQATTFEVGVLSAAGAAAPLLFALPAGVWVDRLPRRPVMIASDIGRLLVLGSVTVAASLGVLGMPQLYAAAFLAGALTIFFDVAYQSYLPALVGREHLVHGNARLAASAQVAGVAGPSLAGVLVQAIGGPYAVAVDAASFLVSAGSLGAIRAQDVTPAAPRGDRQSLRADVAQGLRFVAGNPVFRLLMTATAIANFFGSASLAVILVFLVRVLHQPPAVIGLLSAAGSVGGVLGAMFTSRIGRWLGHGRSMIAGSVVAACGTLLWPLSEAGTGLAVYGLGWFLVGLGLVLYNVNLFSFRQALCPDRLLGRVTATMRWVVGGTVPLGSLLGGALGAAIGVRATLWVGGAGTTLAVFCLLASRIGRMRELPGDPEDDPGGVPGR